MPELISRAMTDEDAFADEAMRRIATVRDSFSADLDKLRTVIARGGGVKEMRSAVNAYDALVGVERELAAAIQRVEEPASRTLELENLLSPDLHV